MKQLSKGELAALAGNYFAPEGLYQYIKELPFLGSLQCNTTNLVAGQWTEVIITYTVGGSGLADGAWIKGTFKFYSDWALLQTSDGKADNYVSAEYEPGQLLPSQTPATVQGLSVRFDQKGHERPFQKAIIIDIVDGYLNPGDKIVVRIGDTRFGARGTRVQTFVEEDFRMRWYIDPVGTSRFAPIKPDLSFDIFSGDIAKLKVITPRVVGSGVEFPIHIHTEDVWGNATANQLGLHAQIKINAEDSGSTLVETQVPLNSDGWTSGSSIVSLIAEGEHLVTVTLVDAKGSTIQERKDKVSVSSHLGVPRVLYADLHVHSDDTVGTNSTTYNFSYAQKVAGLDVIGYTANDFNITKDRWEQTLGIIRETNKPGEVVIFPGTEWCGNSAAGGDHNVVFLDDPSKPIEFPLDRHGNVARSFEWNEHGPAELQPGTWPLEEVYATYAHSPESHLLIPHVGGRRCNLAWHHPRLERLLEIGSAWGHFEWLLQDAVRRGWKMGVCANSDEHRGRCGGGVPGTAVFGTKGGLTGVLAPSLNRAAVAKALRARHTFATTGERLVGLASINSEGAIQGDDVHVNSQGDIDLDYAFYGSNGFSSIEAWDASGIIWQRDLRSESRRALSGSPSKKTLVIKWGGARLYDRYREAVWTGTIETIGAAKFSNVQSFGGVLDVPEEAVVQKSDNLVSFETHTSGDFDGVLVSFEDNVRLPGAIKIQGTLGGYVKVGDPLKGNPHKAQPTFDFEAPIQELDGNGGKRWEIAGGAGLFVSAELVDDAALPTQVVGRFSISARASGQQQSVYLVGREWDGGKVITSPLFLEWT
ncbi:hypothetical protein N8I77_007670 [Diaporthe amygdali]|uniref:Polymerase/histidinol phosphatase N-terminal domain-containing protein n=1 Tax=Phomopsis amygdali TaxID=1214568 RepID=A0AAD9SDI4_PHOAM|nr:hypothetical protein N8I77_007670 [Diaporthe amygdali]